MNNILIIEDEKSASRQLVNTLSKTGKDVNVAGIATSVAEGIAFLKGHQEIDLIFSDVQLSDGLSFSIFSEVNCAVPVIFITAYDKFIVEIFEYNGIHYILKPFLYQDIVKALEKYEKLKSHFSTNQVIRDLMRHLQRKKRNRFLVRLGTENYSLPLQDIVLFYTRNKMVYAVDAASKKYTVDANLSELETELEGTDFYRVNRQYLVNGHYIRGFKNFDKVKIAVQLSIPSLAGPIIVSQETASQFKKWISQI